MATEHEAIAPQAPIWEQIRKPAGVRAMNAVGSGLRKLGVAWPKLTVDGLLRLARRRARLSDFGEPDFREGLEVLVDGFNGHGTANAFGRFVFREYVTNLLVNRLKIQAELTRHPEILDVPVERPLFIIGLPRSGTTFLHRLMSEDPAGRTLLCWEAMYPAPAPEPSTYRTDPRIARADRSARFIESLSPRFSSAHEFEATLPEEDNDLHARGFVAGILGFYFDVPDYVRWLDEVGHDRLVENYRYARRQLQLLSWKVRADHWVLKAPAHQYAVGALFEAFPDARVIVTHRDPRAVVPSVTSLAAGFRGILADRLDLRLMGEEFVEAIAQGPVRVIEARESLDPSRIFDVGYGRMIADPIGTVRDACSHLGYDFTPEYEARATRWLAENPQHKKGVHRYKLEDFGLDGETVDRHFARYLEWLAERPELGVRAGV